MSQNAILVLRTTEHYQRNNAIYLEPGKKYQISDLIADTIEPLDVIGPRYAICKMVRQPDGDYRPVPVAWDEWIPVAPEFLRKIGVHLSRRILIRLWRNNYLVMKKPSPHSLELNVESLVRHLKAVADDPNFWSRPAHDGTARTRAEAYDSKAIYV